MPKSFVLALFAPLVLTGFATAQKILVPSGVLTAGQTIEVGFEDAGHTNGTVTITVDNGDPLDPQSIDIEIKLDAGGKGRTSFTVPDWWSVTFNGGGAKEVTRAVQEPQRSRSAGNSAIEQAVEE